MIFSHLGAFLQSVAAWPDWCRAFIVLGFAHVLLQIKCSGSANALLRQRLFWNSWWRDADIAKALMLVKEFLGRHGCCRHFHCRQLLLWKTILQSGTVLKDSSSGLQALLSRHQILFLAELWPSLKIPQFLPYPLSFLKHKCLLRLVLPCIPLCRVPRSADSLCWNMPRGYIIIYESCWMPF